MNIILYDFEIQNLLKNGKGQIRRAIKEDVDYFYNCIFGEPKPVKGLEYSVRTKDGKECYIKCPFGAVGEDIWCKETWLKADDGYYYKVNSSFISEEARKDFGYRWKSPATMPREASRLTIVPERIWAERVQDITKDGLLAEGAETDEYLDFVERASSVAPPGSHVETLKEYFAKLWDLKNCHSEFDPNRWDANPMVFAAEVMVK